MSSCFTQHDMQDRSFPTEVFFSYETQRKTYFVIEIHRVVDGQETKSGDIEVEATILSEPQRRPLQRLKSWNLVVLGRC